MATVTRKDQYGNEVEVEVGQDGKNPVSPNNPLPKSQNFTNGLNDGIRETEPEKPVAEAIANGQYVFSYEPGPLKEYEQDELPTEHSEGDPHGQYPHSTSPTEEAPNPASEEVPSERNAEEKDAEKLDDPEDHKSSKKNDKG